MKSLLLAIAFLFAALPPIPSHAQNASGMTDGEIVVTILFNNISADERLATGWGFAALLETPDHTILLDTGADGGILLENMRILRKDPMAIETVVISHDHSDHTGGLQALLDLGLRPKLVLLSAFPAEMREWAASATEMVEASPGDEIVPGIRTTGQVGTAIPEQALIIETAEGTVVLTGCAHPGPVLMTERAQELDPGPIHAVLGGFHLMAASADDIQSVLGDFRRLEVTRAGPTHCSGELTMSVFQDAYGENFVHLGAGTVLRFPI